MNQCIKSHILINIKGGIILILNLFFLFSVLSSISLIVFLIYNFSYFLSERYFKDIYTENQRERINTYKRKSIYTSLILTISLVFIIVYTRPVSFSRAIGLSRDNEIGISIWGNISGAETNLVDGDNSSRIINVLEKYKYSRIFPFDDISGNSEFMMLKDNDDKNIVIEIWESGYVKIPNYKVYKVDSQSNQELYDMLQKEINNMIE